MIIENKLPYENFFEIREESLLLRGFSERELLSDAYLKWCNDPEVVRKIGRDDYLLPVSRQKLIDYFKNLQNSKTAFLAIYFIENAKETFIGTLKIYDIDILSRKASIGIMIGNRSFWGKGIATKALKLSLHYIFKILKLEKACAGYQSDNIGMARAFEKAGFHIEGSLKKHIFTDGAIQDLILVACFRENS